MSINEITYAIINNDNILTFVCNYDQFVNYIKKITLFQDYNIELINTEFLLPINENLKNALSGKYLIDDEKNKTIYLVEKCINVELGYIYNSTRTNIVLLNTWKLINVGESLLKFVCNKEHCTVECLKIFSICDRKHCDEKCVSFTDKLSLDSEKIVESVETIIKPIETIINEEKVDDNNDKILTKFDIRRFDPAPLLNNTTLAIVGNNIQNNMEIAYDTVEYIIDNNSNISEEQVYIFDNNLNGWLEKFPKINTVKNNFSENMYELFLRSRSIQNRKNIVVMNSDVIDTHSNEYFDNLITNCGFYNLTIILMINNNKKLNQYIRSNLDYVFINNDPLSDYDAISPFINFQYVTEKYYENIYEYYVNIFSCTHDLKYALNECGKLVVKNCFNKRDEKISDCVFYIN